MVILEIEQKQTCKNGELPRFETNYKVISQQFFLDEDREKAEKLRDEINEHFNDEERDLYHAKTFIIW
jgi:hypothetical protein